MKIEIEIDTREESPADLRRIARLLEQLADKAPVQPAAQDSGDDSVDPSAMPGAFGMFDDDDDDDAPVERASADEDFRITTY